MPASRRLNSQIAPSAKRCIKTGDFLECQLRLLVVRKHRAPKGALRRVREGRRAGGVAGQKAPSAERCIKTQANDFARVFEAVRKRRSPEGTLRQIFILLLCSVADCRSESTESHKVH